MIFYGIFGDIVGWDWGNPRHIATKPPLEKLNQNLGLVDPPLSWDKRQNFSNEPI